ncbi:MAG: PTS fructose transporter subunit IIA [Atopobiaceae bacterium]|nr:PTS fructose transporter subunit IIA [Atopobiaceae bacterium]
MVGFVLTGHGDFAPGLASAVEMVAPQTALAVVPFHDDTAHEYPTNLKAAVEQSVQENGSTIVFCDLVGGTPFNQAMIISQEMTGVEVVGGVNLPMLLEMLVSRTFLGSAADVAAESVCVGRFSIVHAQLDDSIQPTDTTAEQTTDDSAKEGI